MFGNIPEIAARPGMEGPLNPRLYVGNLSANVTEATLRELFSQKGPISEITLMIESTTGHSRGFAFVTMATPEAATSAMTAYHNHPLGGRYITVTEARPKEEPRPGTLIGDGNFSAPPKHQRPARPSRSTGRRRGRK
jgi:cold-inducible RNA-binding protein